MRRYRIVRHYPPKWAIFDALTGTVAERDGKPLSGVTKREAEEAAFNLLDNGPAWLSGRRV